MEEELKHADTAANHARQHAVRAASTARVASDVDVAAAEAAAAEAAAAEEAPCFWMGLWMKMGFGAR